MERAAGLVAAISLVVQPSAVWISLSRTEHHAVEMLPLASLSVSVLGLNHLAERTVMHRCVSDVFDPVTTFQENVHARGS